MQCVLWWEFVADGVRHGVLSVDGDDDEKEWQ